MKSEPIVSNKFGINLANNMPNNNDKNKEKAHMFLPIFLTKRRPTKTGTVKYIDVWKERAKPNNSVVSIILYFFFLNDVVHTIYAVIHIETPITCRNPV